MAIAQAGLAAAQGVAAEHAASMGEQLMWSGRPLPGRHALRAMPGVLLGLPFAAMSPLWFAGAWSGPARHSLALSLTSSGAGILFAVVGASLILGPLLAYRRAQRTVYAITGAAAHVIVLGVTRRIETYGGPDLAQVRCVERSDGSGDLLFPRRMAGRTRVDSGGFRGVPNVRQVERLLRSAASHEAAIPATAPDTAAVRAVRQIAVLGSVLMLGFFGFTAFSMLRSSPGMSRSAPASPPAAAPGLAEAPDTAPLPAAPAVPSPARSAAPPRATPVPRAPAEPAAPAPSATERDAIACATGAADACSRAGFALAHGTAGAPDPQRAAPLLARGCDLGSAGACRQLGWMLSKGEGIAPDAASALARNVRGCELGDGDACSAAAFTLAYGQGVGQDRAAAVRMAERSCGDGSHPRACAVLGDVLEGRAGDGDRARALKVYRGCCTSGDTGCCSSAERLARALP